MKREYEDYLRDMLENAEVIWRTVQDDLPVIIRVCFISVETVPKVVKTAQFPKQNLRDVLYPTHLKRTQ